jgi:hypothetical protein
MDPVHAAVDIFHGFFFSKIILKILKIPERGNFAKTPLNFSKIIF